VVVEDGLLVGLFEPVVAWVPGVMFVGLAVAVLPRRPRGGSDADPQKEAGDGDAGFVAPMFDTIDDLVAEVVGDPESV
jgi:hypothetical protein